MTANVQKIVYPPELIAQRSQLYQQLGGLFGNISLPTLVFTGLIILVGAAIIMRD